MIRTRVSCFIALTVLTEFTLSNDSRRYQVFAKGPGASISSFAPLLAARDVQMSVTDKHNGAVRTFNCRSFSFGLRDSFGVCEMDSQSFIFDLENSQIDYLK